MGTLAADRRVRSTRRKGRLRIGMWIGQSLLLQGEAKVHERDEDCSHHLGKCAAASDHAFSRRLQVVCWQCRVFVPGFSPADGSRLLAHQPLNVQAECPSTFSRAALLFWQANRESWFGCMCCGASLELGRMSNGDPPVLCECTRWLIRWANCQAKGPSI